MLERFYFFVFKHIYYSSELVIKNLIKKVKNLQKTIDIFNLYVKMDT